VKRLSIIVPFFGDSQKNLETTLVSILQNRPASCEILVVHNGGYDDPYELVDEVRFITAGECLLDGLNVAIESSHGEVVHLVEPGIEVEPGWTDWSLVHFADPDVAAVSPLVLSQSSPVQVVCWGVNYFAGGHRQVVERNGRWDSKRESLPRIMGPTMSASFYRRQTLVELGLFDRWVGQRLADIDVALKLKAAAYRVVIEPDSRLYGAYETRSRDSHFQTDRFNERLFWRYAAHFGWVRSLSLHGLVISFSVLACLLNLARLGGLMGRLAGILDLSFLRFAAHAEEDFQKDPPASFKFRSGLRVDAAHDEVEKNKPTGAPENASLRARS